MATTIFQDYNQNNPIVSSWLNDVNADTYTPLTGITATPGGTPRVAVQQAAAWVRFSVTAGVVAIQQSSNIASVVRVSAGLYQINYGIAMVNTANCYSMSCNTAGFGVVGAETANYVQIYFENPADSATFDPGFVSLTVFGSN